MPVPIAHPAAVLPLRRCCPGQLCLAGLIIGSLVPDFAYCVPRFDLGGFSHSWLGSLGFCLPVGLGVFWAFRWLWEPLTRTFPEPHRTALLALGARRWPRLRTAALSIVIGSWTHIAWDAFTHRNGWLVERLPWLSHEVMFPGGNGLSSERFFWVISSVAGGTALLVAYARFLKSATGSRRLLSAGQWPRVVGWSAALLVPALFALAVAREQILEAPSLIGSYKRFAHSFVETYLVAFTSLLVAAGVVLKFRAKPPDRPGAADGERAIPPPV